MALDAGALRGLLRSAVALPHPCLLACSPSITPPPTASASPPSHVLYLPTARHRTNLSRNLAPPPFVCSLKCILYRFSKHPGTTPVQALKEEGRTKEAERVLLKALALDPPDQPAVHVLRVLAQMKQQKGEHAAAIKLLDRALPVAEARDEQVRGGVGGLAWNESAE